MVQVGDAAPSLGADFSWLWASGPAVIVWTRHFGCQFFPERIAELRDAQDRFHALGVNIRCVVQGNKDEAKQFCGALGAESLCIADPLRRSYQMMGLERTSYAATILASPELKARRREAKNKGFKQDWGNTFRRNSDVLQLPGAALIDQKGIVRWIYRGSNSGDLPPVSTLLSVAERAATLARNA